MSGEAKWVVAGVVTGVVCAAVWAALIYVADIQLGILAWVIGGAVGLVIRVAAEQDAETGVKSGIAAVLITLLSICVGKYVGVTLIINREVDKMVAAERAGIQALTFDDTDAQLHIADRLAVEAMGAGRTIVWPTGYDYESANEPEHYPKDLWRQAQVEWRGIPAADQTAMKETLLAEEKKSRSEDLDAAVAAVKSEATFTGFLGTFRFFGTISVLLGLATAYRLASTDTEK